MKKKSLDDELRELSPWLRDMKWSESDGMRVPPDYFESLEDSVFEQIDALGARRAPAKAPAMPGGGFWERMRAWLWQSRHGLALGSVVLLAAAIWYWSGRPKPAQADMATTETPATTTPDTASTLHVISNMSTEDAGEWTEANIMDFEPEQLAVTAPGTAAPTSEPSTGAASAPTDMLPSDALDPLLQDMTEEELEALAERGL